MSKRIIFCADGTWNTSHGPSIASADTNVRRLFLALEDDASQMRYYDSGVGTHGSLAEHLFGGALGEGLFQKVQDGYRFLAYVWDLGDPVYLFGFSRGAYVARSLAGMTAAFGVPTRNFDDQTVPRIFQAYRTRDLGQRALLKQQLTEEYGLKKVEIRMVGVWDTVGALGIPGHLFGTLDAYKYGFLDTALNPTIQSAFHALSIDERRSSFGPTLWTNPDGTVRSNDSQVTQVWFSGVHTDVGGGQQEPQLANITLRWMIDQAERCGLPLMSRPCRIASRPCRFSRWHRFTTAGLSYRGVCPSIAPYHLAQLCPIRQFCATSNSRDTALRPWRSRWISIPSSPCFRLQNCKSRENKKRYSVCATVHGHAYHKE